MIKSKIAFFIFFVFISQGNIILANENIDCEEIRIDIDKPSYALTEEEKIQILDMELINTLNRFDECMENKNKSIKSIIKNSNKWKIIIKKTKLKANSSFKIKNNYFKKINYIKLNIYPDGGISRFRAIGKIK